MPYKLHLVEDHDWLRQIYVDYLSRQDDLEIAGAFATGEECLKHLNPTIDLVIADISLRGMSGLELVRLIRAQWPDIPCIVLSGQTSVERATDAEIAGAARYLEKAEFEQLLNTIYEVLSQAKL